VSLFIIEGVSLHLQHDTSFSKGIQQLFESKTDSRKTHIKKANRGPRQLNAIESFRILVRFHSSAASSFWVQERRTWTSSTTRIRIRTFVRSGMSDQVSTSGCVQSAAGPLALPWRQASLSAYDVCVLGLAPKPLKVKGARAVLEVLSISDLLASGACGRLTIDGFKTTFRGRGKRLWLNTRDVLGAKVRCLFVA
jgi:hypothetical protein